MHTVSEDLLTISEDKLEDQAGLGLYDGRRASVENRDRTLSLRSVSSEACGYATGEKHPASENLPAISEDCRDKKAEFELLNGPKLDSTSDFVMFFPFITFGRLYLLPTSSESYPTISNFIVAVSLTHFLLWAIYDARDEDCVVAKEGGEVD